MAKSNKKVPGPKFDLKDAMRRSPGDSPREKAAAAQKFAEATRLPGSGETIAPMSQAEFLEHLKGVDITSKPAAEATEVSETAETAADTSSAAEKAPRNPDKFKAAGAEIGRRTRVGYCRNCGYTMAQGSGSTTCPTCGVDNSTPDNPVFEGPNPSPEMIVSRRRELEHGIYEAKMLKAGKNSEEVGAVNHALSAKHNTYRSSVTGMPVGSDHPNAVGEHEGQHFHGCTGCKAEMPGCKTCSDYKAKYGE